MNVGELFVVATPIGHLDDWSARARQVLAAADAILCEDTRHSQRLLGHYGIQRPLVPYHDHNERDAAQRLVARMAAGEKLALISDAGTPLVSDPGFRLVREARAAGVKVTAIPGACAAIAALSIAGLPSDRFVFEGFLPAKSGPRREHLRGLAAETRTLIFYEARHRIVETLADLVAEFGAERPAVLARELTKLHETVLSSTLAELSARVSADAEQQLGEMVIVVAGAPDDAAAAAQLREGQRVYALLAQHLPAGKAAKLASEISGAARNALYGGEGGS